MPDNYFPRAAALFPNPMKTVPSRSRTSSGIEALESRIAPARVILVGAPDFPNKADVNYDEQPFVNTEEGVIANDPISLKVGGGAVGVDDTFYLRLSKGDVLSLFTSQDNSSPLLTVNSGNVVAFFIDGFGGGVPDNEIQQNELVSIALGKDTSIVLKSGVAGDLVTNLNENNTANLADDDLNMSDLVSAKQGIKGMLIGGGSVSGNIFSGGPVSNVTINGGVQSLLTGSAAFGRTFDFFPTVVGGDGILNGVAGVQPAPGEDGPSITGVNLNDDLLGRIEAGGGGAGSKGGNLSQIVITNDTTGFVLQAGKGGDAAGAKKNGGLGGGVVGVYVAGITEDPLAPTPNSLVQILAGEGGTSTIGGNGGNGGALSKVYVGFQLAGGKPIPSAEVLVDNIEIAGGKGGAGKTGGNAGLVSTVRVTVSTANVAGDEIKVTAGTGGDSNFVGGGKAGTGGSILDVDLRNLAFTTGGGGLTGLDASILVQAGDGGTAFGAGTAAKGGSITTATLLGSSHKVLAGNGSSAKTGGDGGTVKTVTLIEGDNVLAHNASFRAGNGGNGGNGNGGKGGDMLGIRVVNGDFSILEINPTDGGDGGMGTNGKGGKAGLVTGIDIVEVNSGAAPPFTGTFNLNSGDGGNGTNGGGDGGAISVVTFDGSGMNASVVSGNGGSVLAGGKGNGGLGGFLSKVEIASEGVIGAAAPAATVLGGSGGAGVGTAGKGGSGANLLAVSVRMTVPLLDQKGGGLTGSLVNIRAGDGGNGDGGAAGKGGDITSSAGFATLGDGILQSGNAGALGAKPGIGGNIVGVPSALSGIYASNNVTIRAGDGSHGGQGGSIKLAGYGVPADSVEPDAFPGAPTVRTIAPKGEILVQAGNGTAEGKTAGKGGSIDLVNGSVSLGAAAQTRILAGTGGGNVDKEADGGSITNLGISVGGATGGVLLIEAGDAGTGGLNVSKGAKGGSVNGVQISDIAAGTIIRHISAGDGGSAAKTGGEGGSIKEVRVLGHDIGVRSGQAFGYATMGGLFAGAGGNATVGVLGKGMAGSVTNITATAIAAIVAGKGAVPEAVKLVDFITIGTPTDLLKASEGDLDLTELPDPTDPTNRYHAFIAAAYAQANLVGAVVDPTAMNGNRFNFTDGNGNGVFDLGETPTDGLILAKNINSNNLNFTAEAQFAELLNGKVVQTPTLEKVVGTAADKEVQEYTANISGGTYKLSFNKQETAYVTVGATAAEVEAALNGLASVAAAGGVTVTSVDNGTIRTFNITFNTTGNKMPVSILPHPFYDYDNLA